MNEYLIEMMLSQEDATKRLSDEEIIIMNSYQKVRINRKKRQKELLNNGKESNYNFYC